MKKENKKRFDFLMRRMNLTSGGYIHGLLIVDYVRNLWESVFLSSHFDYKRYPIIGYPSIDLSNGGVLIIPRQRKFSFDKNKNIINHQEAMIDLVEYGIKSNILGLEFFPEFSKYGTKDYYKINPFEEKEIIQVIRSGEFTHG